MSSTGVAGPETLAKDQLRELLEVLADPRTDLMAAIPRCVSSCILLGWSEDQLWLDKELKGFAASDDLPLYRQNVPARVTWRPDGHHALIAQLVEDDFATPEEAIAWNVRQGLSDLLRYSEKGVAWATGKTDTRWSRLDKKDMEVKQRIVISGSVYSALLDSLRVELLKWATQAYKVVAFGDTAGDIWRDYRANVDEWLTRVGMGGHVDAVNRRLKSDDPLEWRQAMYSVRDVLHDVAKYLWRDGRETYEYLKNDKGQPFRVTESDYVNRLCSYLHQKGVTGTDGAYLRSEVSRLHALNGLASKAHDEVTLEQARAGAVALYTVLGIFTVHTDMAPIEEYGPLDEADVGAKEESDG